MAGYGGGYGSGEGLPGGGLNAVQELYGPGTTAYEAYGPYSSYARESDRGGVLEQNVTDTLGYGNHEYFAQSTEYTYHGTDYSYSSYSTSRLSDYAGYAYGTGYTNTSSYTASSTVTVDRDGLSTVQQYSTGYYTFADGTYIQDSMSSSFQDENGSYVQGSSSETQSSVSGYVGGYGAPYGYPS